MAVRLDDFFLVADLASARDGDFFVLAEFQLPVDLLETAIAEVVFGSVFFEFGEERLELESVFQLVLVFLAFALGVHFIVISILVGWENILGEN